eukprot:5793047-Amphidinium_carterae.1
MPFASSMLKLTLLAVFGPFHGRLIRLKSFSQCLGRIAGLPERATRCCKTNLLSESGSNQSPRLGRRCKK